LDLFESKIAPLYLPSPKTHLEPNMKCMKCIGSPVAEIWPFAYVEGIWNPHFWEKGRS